MNIYDEIEEIINGTKFPNGVPMDVGGRTHIKKYRTFTTYHTLHAHLLDLNLKPQVFKNKKHVLMQAHLVDNDFVNFVFGERGYDMEHVFISSNLPIRDLYKKHFWTGWIHSYPTDPLLI